MAVGKNVKRKGIYALWKGQRICLAQTAAKLYWWLCNLPRWQGRRLQSEGFFSQSGMSGGGGLVVLVEI